jgi:signal transduction histidine kinase
VQSAELALDWHLAVDPGLEPPERQAMAVFRIFQEMLSNVGRHARASRLAVSLTQDGPELCVAVADNDVGAAPQVFEAGNAYGIMGMRERARHFGGELNVVSTPGQGTCATLKVKL